MKLKLTINNKPHEMEILYGRTVMLCYESICSMAGVPTCLGSQISYTVGEHKGVLLPLQKLEVKVTDTPSFSVAES